MTATPTPGDLSARHVEVLQGVLEAAVCPMKEHGCDGTQYPVGDPQGDYHGEQCQWCHERTEAIAALSALPAGGCDVLTVPRAKLAGLHHKLWSLRFDGHRCDARVACEAVEQSLAAILRTTPPADADVGAQGEDDDRATIGVAIKMLRADGFTRMADAIQRRLATPADVGAQGEGLLERAYEVVHHEPDCPAIGGNGDDDCRCDAVPFLRDLKAALAAPAAGKGVDDAMRVTEEMDAYCDGRYREDVDDVVRDWRDRLRAALTRQPVAGDGQQATKDAFHDGVILALQVLTSGGDMGNAHYVELVNCCGLDELVKRAKAEGMLKLSGLSDYRRRESKRAAPAATPTDGGEGES